MPHRFRQDQNVVRRGLWRETGRHADRLEQRIDVRNGGNAAHRDLGIWKARAGQTYGVADPRVKIGRRRTRNATITSLRPNAVRSKPAVTLAQRLSRARLPA